MYESNIHHFQYSHITSLPKQSIKAVPGLVMFLQNEGWSLQNAGGFKLPDTSASPRELYSVLSPQKLKDL
jgi:hypothetical protein